MIEHRTVTSPGAAWPPITLVTPNLNGGRFLEQTIKSVADQRYPNLKYIVVDGGSTDNSVEIIQRYSSVISKVIIEKDSGQANAINKGLQLGTGGLANWLNSDDMLSADALITIGKSWLQHEADLVIGGGATIQDGNTVHRWMPIKPRTPDEWFSRGQSGLGISQPSCFFSLDLFRQYGGLREDLHFVLDLEFYIRLFSNENPSVLILDTCLSLARAHSDAKTIGSWQSFVDEFRDIKVELLGHHAPEWRSAARRSLEHHSRFGQVEQARANGIFPLLMAGVTNPSLLKSRFYWGAVRRSLYPFD